jgi:hypothetical protein
MQPEISDTLLAEDDAQVFKLSPKNHKTLTENSRS